MKMPVSPVIRPPAIASHLADDRFWAFWSSFHPKDLNDPLSDTAATDKSGNCAHTSLLGRRSNSSRTQSVLYTAYGEPSVGSNTDPVLGLHVGGSLLQGCFASYERTAGRDV